MLIKRLKGAAVGCAALAIASTALYAAGNYSAYPILGGASFCVSTVGVNGQQGNTGQGGGAAGTAGAYCAQTVPAGPTALTGTELVPMDTGLANGASPQSIVMPSTLLANGYGGTTVDTTTGAQTPAVANGISTFVYAGAGTATFTTFTFPPAPIQNQKLCLVNAGTGIVTLSSLLVGTSGQVFVGTTPTSLPVQTAVGTAGTVTLATNCWLYNVSNTTWYRVL